MIIKTTATIILTKEEKEVLQKAAQICSALDDFACGCDDFSDLELAIPCGWEEFFEELEKFS